MWLRTLLGLYSCASKREWEMQCDSGLMLSEPRKAFYPTTPISTKNQISLNQVYAHRSTAVSHVWELEECALWRPRNDSRVIIPLRRKSYMINQLCWYTNSIVSFNVWVLSVRFAYILCVVLCCVVANLIINEWMCEASYYIYTVFVWRRYAFNYDLWCGIFGARAYVLKSCVWDMCCVFVHPSEWLRWCRVMDEYVR